MVRTARHALATTVATPPLRSRATQFPGAVHGTPYHQLTTSTAATSRPRPERPRDHAVRTTLNLYPMGAAARARRRCGPRRPFADAPRWRGARSSPRHCCLRDGAGFGLASEMWRPRVVLLAPPPTAAQSLPSVQPTAVEVEGRCGSRVQSMHASAGRGFVRVARRATRDTTFGSRGRCPVRRMRRGRRERA